MADEDISNWEAISASGHLRNGPRIGLQWMNCPRSTLVVLATLILLAAAPFASPQGGQPTEYQLKAAFLFNFAKFIEWPEKSFGSKESPFTVCVIGQDPFGSALEVSLLGKTMGSRAVQIMRFPNPTILAEARHCQIVFISASEKIHFHDVIESLNSMDALLVGDADGFVASGGTIEFMVEDNHIRFLINPDAAGRSDLKVSSKLLALAKIVHDGANNGKS
jgi:YfiR/HmsC-like